MKAVRSDLLAVLEMVRPGLAVKEINEQTTCLCFKGGRVFTYNDEVSCSAPTGLDKDFTAAVQAKPLLGIMGKLEYEECEVEVKDDKLFLIGNNGRSKTWVRMVGDILLPIHNVEPPKKWVKLHEDFSEAVGLVESCAGRDENKFYLTCVHLHPRWVEACDDLQITRYRMETGVSRSVLVRRDCIKHLSAPYGMNEFSEADNWIHFRNPSGFVFSCRKWSDEYPDFSKQLKVRGEPVVFPKGLSQVLERADVFSSENPDSNLVKVELRAKRLVVKGEGVSGGHLEDRKTSYSGPPLSFYVSPKLLAEIVKKTNKCEVTRDKLRVNGGKWKYATSLGVEDGGEETVEKKTKRSR